MLLRISNSLLLIAYVQPYFLFWPIFPRLVLTCECKTYYTDTILNNQTLEFWYISYELFFMEHLSWHMRMCVRVTEIVLFNFIFYLEKNFGQKDYVYIGGKTFKNKTRFRVAQESMETRNKDIPVMSPAYWISVWYRGGEGGGTLKFTPFPFPKWSSLPPKEECFLPPPPPPPP